MASKLTQIPPMTHQQCLNYAVRLRAFSLRMKDEGDLVSAEFNDWLSERYNMTAEEYQSKFLRG